MRLYSLGKNTRLSQYVKVRALTPSVALSIVHTRFLTGNKIAKMWDSPQSILNVKQTPRLLSDVSVDIIDVRGM